VSSTPAFDPGAAASPDSGVFGLPCGPDDAAVHLLPVPFEATTSYGGGTARGPAAILAASRQVDLFDLHHGRAYERGIWMAPEDPAVRRWNRTASLAAAPVIRAGGINPRNAGNAAKVNALCAQLNDWVRRKTAAVLDQGRIAGVVGGDHCVPFGAIAEHAERYRDLSVLHVDAHADLRDAFEGFTWSHASIMHNVVHRIPRVRRLVQVGIRDFSEDEHREIRGSRGRIVAFFDQDLAAQQLRGRSFAALARRMVGGLTREVYVSFDIDGLQPSLCPHTGTPVPGGLSFREAVFLLHAVVASGRRIVGFDLCEVTPAPARNRTGTAWDDVDANVGARLLYQLCCLAMRSRPGRRR
jgi:agmatinase